MTDPVTVVIIETIRKVAETIFGMKSNLDKAHRDQKDRVAEYLSKIAQIIEDTSALLNQGTYPHGKCAELHFAADNMTSSIGDVLGKEVEQCQTELKKVTDIEEIYKDPNFNPQSRDHNLSELDRAAGLFRAVAAYARVSP
jgi:hypothetical protein